MPQPQCYILGGGSIGLLWATKIRCTYPSYPLRVLFRQQPKLQQQQQQQQQKPIIIPTFVSLQHPSNLNNQASVSLSSFVVSENYNNTISVVLRQLEDDTTKKKKNIRDATYGTTSSSININNNWHDSIIKVPYEYIVPSPLQLVDQLFNTTTSETTITTETPIDNLIVTTKAYQAKDAIESILHRLIIRPSVQNKNKNNENNNNNNNNNTTQADTSFINDQHYDNIIPDRARIILLCNGALAVRDELNELFRSIQAQQVLSESAIPIPIPSLHIATTTHGAYRLLIKQQQQQQQQHNNHPMNNSTLTKNNNNNDNTTTTTTTTTNDSTNIPTESTTTIIVHAGYKGSITFIENAPDIAVVWDNCGLNCTSISSYEMEFYQLWYKLATNCIINPITALHNCTNGQLVTVVLNFNELYTKLLYEIALVYQAVLADNINSSNTNNNESATNILSIDEIVSNLRNYVDTVITATAMNRSSMLQDIDAQRKTEIDYLSGYVVQKGRYYNIACPTNQYLWEQIKLLEAKITTTKQKQ